ncbi:hypothetical protein CVP05_09630 [Conservatibacter flavescens]|uniref:Integrase catalytic domain-containing protein n=1 Tax=Conservatibacter flavescens TaxID=28161 RepID=A0A2M8S0Z3_9PAST|nr:hypothetical protein CVP05_09630 [Conservatibacter flavescens]
MVCCFPFDASFCGDTTYVKVNGVCCYLAIVINLRNRQLIGWKMSRHHDAQLVVDALNQAMLRVKPTTTMLFHSDQGSIYGSKLFTECVQKHGLVQSMSRRGNCWDNAPTDRWFRSFKYEWMLENYPSFESSVSDVKEYIMYYNYARPHQYLDGFTPII